MGGKSDGVRFLQQSLLTVGDICATMYLAAQSIYRNNGGGSMEERLLQQLKRGVLEMLVLGLVSEAPTYGYELLSKLKERSGGLFVLKEGTL